MARVAYIWSQELQDVADQLPANRGRSSMVHGLVHALDLLETQARVDATGANESEDAFNDFEGSPDDDSDGVNEAEVEAVEIAPSTGRAIVVPPILDFGSKDELKRYHDPAYVDFLLRPREAAEESTESESDPESSSGPRKRLKTTNHGLEYDCPPFPALSQYATLIAASTVTACHLLATGSADITINWDGGRHHALRNRASGFCYVADIVLGIMRLVKYGTSKKRKGRPRIMYLDLDLHYGDGVAQAFLSPTTYPSIIPDGKKPPKPPNVLTVSIHHAARDFFPPSSKYSSITSKDTGHPFTLSIPLRSYPSSKTYASVWQSVESVKDAFDPDYAVLQLGVDGLPGDRVGQYGNWSIDRPGGVRWCVEQVKNWGVPLCVLGGGGYDHANAARAWAVATAALLDRHLPLDTTIPDHEHYPAYVPSFSLEVPASHVQNENDQPHLESIAETYSILADRICAIVGAHTTKTPAQLP